MALIALKVVCQCYWVTGRFGTWIRYRMIVACYKRQCFFARRVCQRRSWQVEKQHVSASQKEWCSSFTMSRMWSEKDPLNVRSQSNDHIQIPMLEHTSSLIVVVDCPYLVFDKMHSRLDLKKLASWLHVPGFNPTAWYFRLVSSNFFPLCHVNLVSINQCDSFVYSLYSTVWFTRDVVAMSSTSNNYLKASSLVYKFYVSLLYC